MIPMCHTGNIKILSLNNPLNNSSIFPCDYVIARKLALVK